MKILSAVIVVRYKTLIIAYLSWLYKLLMLKLELVGIMTDVPNSMR